MSNLSYCRFRNTLDDLRDCEEAIYDELDEDEHKARTRLVELCRAIAGDIPDPADLPQEEEE